MSASHDDRHAREDHRNEFALRRRSGERFLGLYVELVHAEAVRLLKQNPALAGEDARVLFSRMVTPELAPAFDSLVRRAAFGVLAARAQDRADTANPTSGDAA